MSYARGVVFSRLRSFVAVAVAAAPPALIVACSLTTDLSGFSTGAEGREAGAGDGTLAADSPSDARVSNDGTTGADVESGTPDGGSAYAAAVLADEPVLYYRLGETDTSKPAKDSSKSVRPAAFKGNIACGVPGAIANDGDTACRFDGTTTAVFLANGPTFAGAALPPYSVEAWARPTDLSGPNGHVIAACEKEPDDGYALFFYMSGKAQLERETTAGRDSVESLTVVGAAYRHVVGTFDGSMLRIYVDGFLSASASASRVIPGASGMPFSIGANTNADTNRFVGDLDEVALYDHALTPERIKKHHDVGLGLSGN